MRHLRKKQIKGQRSGVWALPPKAATPVPEPSPPAAPPSGIERRAFVRHFCDIGALVDSWPAKIENVSRGGLKLVIGRRFEVGTILKVEIATEAQESLSLLLARVVRAAQECAGNWGLGCAFLQEISEEEVQGLLATPSRMQ
jgi:PilZ domain-containing protein